MPIEVEEAKQQEERKRIAAGKRIIYPKESFGISVLTVSPNTERSFEEVARKDVPTGIRYRIVENSELPHSREFRDAWEADFTTFDGVGA